MERLIHISYSESYVICRQSIHSGSFKSASVVPITGHAAVVSRPPVLAILIRLTGTSLLAKPPSLTFWPVGAFCLAEVLASSSAVRIEDFKCLSVMLYQWANIAACSSVITSVLKMQINEA